MIAFGSEAEVVLGFRPALYDHLISRSSKRVGYFSTWEVDQEDGLRIPKGVTRCHPPDARRADQTRSNEHERCPSMSVVPDTRSSVEATGWTRVPSLGRRVARATGSAATVPANTTTGPPCVFVLAGRSGPQCTLSTMAGARMKLASARGRENDPPRPTEVFTVSITHPAVRRASRIACRFARATMARTRRPSLSQVQGQARPKMGRAKARTHESVSR